MHFENIIIGGGPAGLQLAYFFKKHKIEYIILERSNKSGSFFEKFPHSGKLISINKKYVGSDDPDFKLRHDWNSLLNDEKHLFTDYSEDFYPDSSKLVDYLNDFTTKNELNIKYNTSVDKISKLNGNYIIRIQASQEQYICKRLIMATGMSKLNFPDFVLNVKDKIKHYGEYPPAYFLQKENLEEFKNKKVILFGAGNASFELANVLNGIASHILVVGRNKKKWAMSSHYSGDIRSVYLPFMDTFLLKSLNGYDYVEELKDGNENIRICQDNERGKYYLLDEKVQDRKLYNGKDFDKVIFCTGWKFDDSLFDFPVDVIDNKTNLPSINYKFESFNNENLFFIGTLMQSLGLKQSSSGFIHGFRYLIKAFVNINYNINYEMIPFLLNNKANYENLINVILSRINSSSDMYQMFSFIGDIILVDVNKKRGVYYKNIPLIHKANLLGYSEKILQSTNLLMYVITLEYGTQKIENYLNFGDNSFGVGNEAKTTLIHPVIKLINPYNDLLIDVYYFSEDIFAEFKDPIFYYEKLKRVFHSVSDFNVLS
jgi:thioredoxin reductase